MNTVEKRFRAIPCLSLDQVPEDLAEKNPLLYRRIIAKRALHAGYEDAEMAGQSIRNMLSDLRHLCDGLGLDFAEIDREAYDSYSAERHHGQVVVSGGTLRPSIAKHAHDAWLPLMKASTAALRRVKV